MARIEGVEKVVNALRAKAAASRKDADVSAVVGYTAAYALFVHENLEAIHKVGQAKFLEQPARQYADELGRIVRDALRAGKTMGQAMLLAALRLQRESQLLCPVDTGAMKGSAFTRLE